MTNATVTHAHPAQNRPRHSPTPTQAHRRRDSIHQAVPFIYLALQGREPSSEYGDGRVSAFPALAVRSRPPLLYGPSPSCCCCRTRSPPPASSSPSPAGATIGLLHQQEEPQQVLLHRRRCRTDHLHEEPSRDLEVPLPGRNPSEQAVLKDHL